ncbi:hypothetical protein BJV78DRAFT_1176240 [Lactifluus subvellereus]|nr:hypothetical protein BJV78DRAFT_1176240 [Lactifluus subvellereus]
MRMIGHLTATSSEGWAVVLEVCERASPTEASAKESTKIWRSAMTTVSGKGAHCTYLSFRSSMHEKQGHGHPRRFSYFAADLTRYS